MQEAAKGKLPRDVGGGAIQASGCPELPSALGLACWGGLCSQGEASHGLCEGTFARSSPLLFPPPWIATFAEGGREGAAFCPIQLLLQEGAGLTWAQGRGWQSSLQGKWLVRERKGGIKLPVEERAASPRGGGQSSFSCRGTQREAPDSPEGKTHGDTCRRPSPSPLSQPENQPGQWAHKREFISLSGVGGLSAPWHLSPMPSEQQQQHQQPQAQRRNQPCRQTQPVLPSQGALRGKHSGPCGGKSVPGRGVSDSPSCVGGVFILGSFTLGAQSAQSVLQKGLWTGGTWCC